MGDIALSLIIPTYNERDNIGILLERVHEVLTEAGHPFEVIVVDDDSPDRTWEVAQALITDYPRLRVIRRVNERGLARAVVRGWQEARGDLLAVMDGDLQHPPETLGPLIEALQQPDVDIAVASRHTEGGGVSRWSVIRRGISWMATLTATWVMPGTLATVRDPMSGFFALRRAVIEGRRLAPEGYKILLEVLARGRYQAVKEVPYIFVERESGQSKLTARQYLEFGAHLTRLSWETGERKRFVKYSVVGASGVLVNMGVLAALTSTGMGYVRAGALAVEAAIATNFLLNETWSFADFARRSPRLTARVKRFLNFNLFCLGGAVINLAVLWVLTDRAGLHYLISNLVGIGAATLWNYGMNANITWDSMRAESMRKP
jgi:dolichol-phosphate mannosyltransferase